MDVNQTTALMAATLRKAEQAVLTIYAGIANRVEAENFSAYKVGAVVRVDFKLPWIQDV